MAYLYRTASFGSSNDSSCVLSLWFKKSVNDIVQGLFLGWNNSSNYSTCYVNSDDTIYYKEKQSNTQYETRITSGVRKFRDLNSWYHLVFQWDYTQASASNRIKVWINGELQTWENTGNLPPQNNSLRLKSSDFRIGDYTHAGSSYSNWKGLMSHVHFIDDATYDTYQASTFGETDSTTGEWKIKIDPGIATNNYGSQGFFVLKDGNSGTDQSGKGNNLSISGTITKTEDCPSNVFCTINPLTQEHTNNSIGYSAGNTNIFFDQTGQWWSTYSTLGAITGKYYAECKIDAVGGEASIGVIPADVACKNQGTGDYLGKETDSIGYLNNGRLFKSDNTLQTGLASMSSGTIVGISLDLDNNTVQFYNNDSAVGNAISLNADTIYLFGCSGYSDTRFYWNFGNGYFNTTAISSAGTNASGNGIFEYDVKPSSATALSTKGLNE